MYEYNYITDIFDKEPKYVQRSGVEFWNALTSREIREKEDAPLFIPALFNDNNRRKNVDTTHITMILVDIDGKENKLSFPSMDKYRHDKKWIENDFTFFAYSTYNHTHSHPKWRMIIPLSEPILASDWADGGWESAMYWFLKTFYHDLAFAPGATDKEFEKYIDGSCKNPSRAYFYPSHPIGGTPLKFQRIGKKITPEDVLCYRPLFKKKVFKKRNFKSKMKMDNYTDINVKLENDLRYNPDKREEFANIYGLQRRNQGTLEDKAVRWVCPDCGRDDATYFFIHGSQAFCRHLESCGWKGTLFELGEKWGWRL